MKKEELELIYQILMPINMRVGKALLMVAQKVSTMTPEEYDAIQRLRLGFNQAEVALQTFLYSNGKV